MPSRRILRIVLWSLLGVVVAAVLLLGGLYFYIAPRLPSVSQLKDVKLQQPLKVYTRDGKPITEYGEVKRTPLKLAQIPPLMVKAVLAAEDDRYFEHPGVDYQGILRALWVVLSTGEMSQGGSTITQQLARDFFLTPEKKLSRKVTEMFLALKMDRELSKQEILELYLNMIFLGHRAYGVAAAAQVYYGKPLNELTPAQMAMIAGLPKGPSVMNPLANPRRSLERRNYVLRRMLETKAIDMAVYQKSLQEPEAATLHGFVAEVEAPYVAEMAREIAEQRFGRDIYTTGMKIFTTLDSRLQIAANQALRNALIAYDKRHGYRGPERHVTLADHLPLEEQAMTQLHRDAPVGGLYPALVTAVRGDNVTAYLADGRRIEIAWANMQWARAYKNPRAPTMASNAPITATRVLVPGDIIRVVSAMDKSRTPIWQLAAIPKVQGALVALWPKTGAVSALVGGFDFGESKFNRAAQAERQPGSSFKPFLYSAALEKGFTPASLINDAPLVFGDPGADTWRPENFSGEFIGPMRLREALTFSRNTVSIRLMQAVGVEATLTHAARFGFQTQDWYPNLSLALGSGATTPLTLASAYSVFATGGVKYQPYIVERIVDAANQVLTGPVPAKTCPGCPLTPVGTAETVISPQNAYLMTSMMQDVVRRGTAARAMALGRGDLAGKTGTTNEQKDAWFAGYNADQVAVAWVGFDKPAPLGGQETGSQAALPMWMDYMASALRGRPEHFPQQPTGLVTVRIDPVSGLLAGPTNPKAIFEVFMADQLPAPEAEQTVPPDQPPDASSPGGGAPKTPEQLF